MTKQSDMFLWLVAFSQNYGDESDAYGLINPSLYSNYGVYEEDFFQERDPATMKRILDSIGVEMTNDVFQQLWTKARSESPSGQVITWILLTVSNDVSLRSMLKC